MSPRSIRRAAERLALKKAKQNPNQGEGQRPLEANETDCKAPCLLVTKHALTDNFRLLQSESQEIFAQLRDALRAEHMPSTATEFLLVDRLAEHVWLCQRAQRFQNQAAQDGDHPWFALMLRYETMHDRGFHKCLAELRTLRRERQQSQLHPENTSRQFESQNCQSTANGGQNATVPSEDVNASAAPQLPTPECGTEGRITGDTAAIAAGSNRKIAPFSLEQLLSLSCSSQAPPAGPSPTRT